MYSITQNLIPGLPKNPYRKGASAYEGVIAHSTATPNATATAERNYETGHWQDAFVHFFVDWTSIIQTADTDYLCWGAGHTANQRYVQVELCETSDPNLFTQSYYRYTWLLAKLLYDKHLGVTHNVTFFTHADTSALFKETDHTDPVGYLASHGVTADQLIKDVTDQYTLLSTPAKTQSVNPSSNGAWKKENDVWYFYENGVKKTNAWIKYKDKWYYVKADGSMAQGWLQYNQKWYFLNPTPDRGEMLTGWLQDKGKKYYLDPQNGDAYVGTHVIDGKTYQFAIDCSLIS